MARKTQNASKSPSYQGYIPTYLDDKAKKAIKANVPSADQMVDKITKWIEDDYRVTLAWSNDRECFTASLFDVSFRRPAGGYILAANHVELLVAVGTLAYLHEKIYADGWDIEKVGQQGDVNW